MHKVLLIEDSPQTHTVVRSILGNKCELLIAPTLAEGMEQLRKNEFALLILDVEMPDGDGFGFCKQLRQDPLLSDLPVIFLTGKTKPSDKVLGFAVGADDYVVKPIEPDEFLARVNAKLNRRPSAHNRTSWLKANIRIDLVKQKAFSRQGGNEEEIKLTPNELKLLVHFFKYEGQVFSREELLEAVWGKGVHVSGHTIDTHISSLRKKLGESGKYLKAVVKKGYCFNSPKES